MTLPERHQGKLYAEVKKIKYLPVFEFLKAEQVDVFTKYFSACLDDAKAEMPTVNFHNLSDMSKFGEWVKKWFGEQK